MPDIKNLNLQHLFAMLAQPKENLEPLKDVESKKLEVKYIKRDGSVETRKIWLYIPKNAAKPMPLVYVGHYEMPLDSVEIRDYLLNGYAVSSPAEFNGKYNFELTYDDLVFNNAALYTLRSLPEVDKDRIAVVGGSAGGYMSLMLNAMQLGICCSVANGPICNVLFNFYQYFNNTKKYNEEAIKKLAQSGKKDYPSIFSELPIPFLGLIGFFGGFSQGVSDIDKDDMKKWEAISPTALAECFCNPLYINQATSDILVPIDQLTKKYTYAKPGETLPVDFNSRMSEYIPGVLKYPLCERLEQDQLNLFKTAPLKEGTVVPFKFDKSKRFNVCICDEGAPESYASHNLGNKTGRATDIEYIRYMFNLTAAKTNVLTVGKLLEFASRYEGKALQLVGHQNIDDSVYGSLAIYRKEIEEELSKYVKDNGKEALQKVAQIACEKDGSSIESINLMLSGII